VAGWISEYLPLHGVHLLVIIDGGAWTFEHGAA
jgi:hypothetical protein